MVAGANFGARLPGCLDYANVNLNCSGIVFYLDRHGCSLSFLFFDCGTQLGAAGSRIKN